MQETSTQVPTCTSDASIVPQRNPNILQRFLRKIFYFAVLPSVIPVYVMEKDKILFRQFISELSYRSLFDAFPTIFVLTFICPAFLPLAAIKLVLSLPITDIMFGDSDK